MTRRIPRSRARALLIMALSSLAVPTSAEVVLGSGAPLPGPAITVSGDIGQQDGANLFHTFSVFNIFAGLGESVTFTPPTAGAPVDNVINRVTGGTSAITGGRFSVIDGPLNSAISGANFFFINPNGIIFGDNAALNISGSFHASTADYLKFQDGNIFSSDSSLTSVLTSAPISAFGFLTANPAPIQVQTSTFNILQTPIGETFSLVGGSVNIGRPDGTAPGFLLAPAGRLNLVSAASAGEIGFDGRGFDVSAMPALGDVTLREGDVGGTVFGSVVDAGEIFVQSGRFTVKDSLVVPGFFAFFGELVPPANGGEINVHATESVTVEGTQRVFNTEPGIRARSGSPFFLPPPGFLLDVPDINVMSHGTVSVSGIAVIQSERFAPGNAGVLSISADSVVVDNGGFIAVRNFLEGSGGQLSVDAREVRLSQGSAATFTGLTTQSDFHPVYPATSLDPALTLATGGDLSVNVAETLVLQGGAGITADSFGFGDSGNISISAKNISGSGAPGFVGAVSVQSVLAGRAGKIDLTAQEGARFNDGFQVSASTLGSGDGGTVTVVAGESVEISNSLQTSDISAGIFSSALPPPDATLDAFAQRFGIPDFAALKLATGLPPEATYLDVFAQLNALGFTAVADLTPGDAGALSVSAPVVRLTGDTRIDSSTATDGNAGALRIAANHVSLADGAAVRSRSGIIRVTTSALVVGQGSAGRIAIDVTGDLSIAGVSSSNGDPSTVSTSTLGDGDGGDVNITALSVAIDNGGAITADSSGAGLAGNISINTADRITLNDGSISTRATTSDGGDIVVNAPVLLDVLNSQITTSVESGVGGGGNISIDPAAVVLQNSSIVANAFGGPGGNIRIVAGQFIVGQNSIVSASSALGIAGNIEIVAPDTNITGKLVPLPKNFLDASKLLRDRCGAAGGGTSSFAAKGSGGVPPGPDGYLPSYAMADDGGVTTPVANTTGSHEFQTDTAAGALLAMAPTLCTW